MLTSFIANIFDGGSTPDIPQYVAKAADAITGDKFELEKKEQSAKRSTTNVIADIEEDFKKVGNVLQEDFKIVKQDVEIGIQYGERIGKDLFNLIKIMGKSAEWLIENNKVVLIIGGVYVGSRIFNEIKQTNII